MKSNSIRRAIRYSDVPAGDSITVGVDHLADPSTPVVSANVAIVMAYKPWYLPLKLRKSFRIVLNEDAAGKFHWFNQPSDEAFKAAIEQHLRTWPALER